MPFKKYNSSNNAIAALNLPLSDTDTTMVLKGNYGRFSTSNFIVKVTKKVGGVVTARENIYVTTRTGATCTGLTRAYEPVPVDDNAATNVQQALEFDTDDIVEQVISAEFAKDMQNEIDAKLPTVAGLRTGFGANKHVRVNRTTGAEESIAVATGTAPASTDKIRVEKAGGTYEDILYSAMQADMAIAGGGSTTITPYESTIAVNDPVGITSDGLFECTTENKSSINISASSVAMLGTVKLDATRTFFMYNSGLVVYGRVGTLTGDTMAFGAQVTIGTGATGGIYGGCCEIGTNKVVTVWGDGTTASANNANHTVLTISGTTITVNTTYVYSMPNTGGGVKPIQTVCKVRTDCYAWGYFNVNTQNCFINSVSGTVITINGTAFISQTTGLANFNGVYLSDNLIGFPVGGNGVATSMNMFAITPGATTIATTYTGYSSDGTGTQTNYLARVSDTEYVATFSSSNQNTVKYTKPPSGTALIVTNIVANGAVGYPVVSVGDSCFGVVNGTTLSVYTRSGQLLGTITSITSPAANSLFQYFKTSNARMVYITGTNGTVRIINLARVFYLGIANNTVGGVLFKGLLTVTGVVTNQLYYVQADGTIGEAFSGKLIGKGIAPNTLLVG